MKRKIKIPKTKEQAKSGQIVASIEDLLTEILIRLHSKSLIRFKLVSKSWLAIITDPKFGLLRYPNPNPAVGLFLPCTNYLKCHIRYEYVPLCVNKPTDPPFKNFEFSKDPYGLKIWHSCNGLLCCSFRSGEFERMRRYYVYNPTTNQFSKLPKLGGGTGVSYEICGMFLAFDPAKSDHHTVVCVRESDKNRWDLQIEIYSSETGSWRVCGESFMIDQVKFNNGVYWNGSIHWISDWNEEALYFNIDHQMLEKMPAPPFTDGWQRRRNYFFGESCDHLHFIDTCVSQIKFDVYEMKRDYSKWFVKYHVDLRPVVAAYPDMIPTDLSSVWCQLTSSSVFCVIRGRKEEDSFLVLQTPLRAIRYNLVYKTFEMVYEFNLSKVKDYYRLPVSNGFQYIESLNHV